MGRGLYDARPYGHPMEGDNLYEAPDGSRLCGIHRESVIGSRYGKRNNSFLCWLKRNDWPNDPRLQVLCYECHVKKTARQRAANTRNWIYGLDPVSLYPVFLGFRDLELGRGPSQRAYGVIGFAVRHGQRGYASANDSVRCSCRGLSEEAVLAPPIA